MSSLQSTWVGLVVLEVYSWLPTVLQTLLFSVFFVVVIVGSFIDVCATAVYLSEIVKRCRTVGFCMCYPF
jgi:hypothetical protein